MRYLFPPVTGTHPEVLTMSKFILTAALAVAALGCATVGTAKAQFFITGGFSQGFSQGYGGGYSPAYYGNGFVPASGYSYGNSYGYTSYPSYNTYPSYNSGYYPSYGSSNYSPALGSHYDFYRRGAVGNSYNYNRRYR